MPTKFRGILAALRQCRSDDGNTTYELIEAKVARVITLFAREAQTIKTVEGTPAIFKKPWNEIALGVAYDFLSRLGATQVRDLPSSETVARLADQSRLMLNIASGVGLVSEETGNNQFGQGKGTLSAAPKGQSLAERVRPTEKEADAAISELKARLRTGHVPGSHKQLERTEEDELRAADAATHRQHLDQVRAAITPAYKAHFALQADNSIRFLLGIAETGREFESRRQAAVHNIAGLLKTWLIEQVEILRLLDLRPQLESFCYSSAQFEYHHERLTQERARHHRVIDGLRNSLKRCAEIAMKTKTAGFTPEEVELIKELTKPPEPVVEAYKLAPQQ